MKQITFILTFVSLFGATVTAQDTAYLDQPPYFYNDWAKGKLIVDEYIGMNASNFVEMATAYYHPDSVRIQGLAVGLKVVDRWVYNATYQDTTLDSLYCFVRLYVPYGDTLLVAGEQRVHLRDTPVSYYLKLNRPSARETEDSLLPMVPIYECFFDHPITVSDSFYVGVACYRFRRGYDTINHCPHFTSRYTVGCLGYADLREQGNPPTVAMHLAPDGSATGYAPGSWVILSSFMYPYFFMYAITDSVGIGGGDTTVFINGSDMVGRYVTVQPNPAVEEARVLSSFGLERIEAYDDRGRLVAEVAAKGYEATLDVKAWTTGTYLLRITTPMGTVTKKLLVQ